MKKVLKTKIVTKVTRCRRKVSKNGEAFGGYKIYREVISKCCDLISIAAGSEMEGYKKPHGMSGANVGIPFNIIGIEKNFRS